MKQFHNEPTEAYFLLIKQIYKLIKIKKHVPLCVKRVKSDVDRGECVNKTIEQENKIKY